MIVRNRVLRDGQMPKKRVMSFLNENAHQIHGRASWCRHSQVVHLAWKSAEIVSRFASVRSSAQVTTFREKAMGVAFSFNKVCAPVVADVKLLVPTYDGRADVYAPNSCASRRSRNPCGTE